jgi:DNA-directed RNA polymerase subunit RPC12/RpoP
MFFAETKVNYSEALGLSIKVQSQAKNDLDNIKTQSKDNPQMESPYEYACDECNKKFTKKQNLRSHIAVLHTGSQICARCNAEFTDKYVLKTHQKSCNFKCPACQKTFSQKRNRDKHMKTHSNV